MNIKRIITAATVTAITLATAVTTAMGVYVEDNHYNENYSYHVKGNELTFNATGDSSVVSTFGGVSNNYNRYCEVAVSKRNVNTDAYISGSSNSGTINTSGISAGMQREPTNSAVYYRHDAILKPSASISFTIDAFQYKITQDPNL
ncbi:MAG: hypothetical protein IJ555_00085 [Ruminococcus sp.]|nr:hypothetical protein [Ruminococcus sp.]